MARLTYEDVGNVRRCQNEGCADIGSVRELGGLPGKFYVHCPTCDDGIKKPERGLDRPRTSLALFGTDRRHIPVSYGTPKQWIDDEDDEEPDTITITKRMP